MRRLQPTALAVTAATLVAAASPLSAVSGSLESPRSDASARSDTTVTVKMLNYDYDPEPIRAQLGDTVRFVNATDVPHDAAFGEVPEDARLASEEVTPFLAQKGDSHELVIDERFVPGTYQIYCTPHRQLGMEGELIITESGESESNRTGTENPGPTVRVPPPPSSPPPPTPPSVTTSLPLPPVSVDLGRPPVARDSVVRKNRRSH